jgi:hypothetical protein
MKLLIFMLCLTSQVAFGFSDSFEYHSLSEREASTFDTPNEIDGEYESDILTYTQSFQDRWLYLSSEHAFTGTFGSLDGKHFFARQSLKFDFTIAPNTRFRVLSFRERDFELDAADTIFEVEHAFDGGPHALALFGSASFDKKEDDIGLAYIWRKTQSEGFETLRIYVSASDFSRNERNTLDDRFKEKPLVAGLTHSKFFTDQTFYEFALRIEPEVKWLFPTDGRVYSYSRYYGYFANRKKNARGFFNLRLEYDSKFEEQKPDSMSSAIVAEEWQTERARLQIEQHLITENSQAWRAGLWLSSADWSKDSDSMTMSYVQPYFWYEFFKRDQYTWDVGGSLVSADRKQALAGIKSPDDGVDSRLNFAWNSRFRENLYLKALFTLDVDRIIESDRWEGGNIQLSTTF